MSKVFRYKITTITELYVGGENEEEALKEVKKYIPLSPLDKSSTIELVETREKR